jgi:hypothetical protein
VGYASNAVNRDKKHFLLYVHFSLLIILKFHVKLDFNVIPMAAENGPDLAHAKGGAASQ